MYLIHLVFLMWKKYYKYKKGLGNAHQADSPCLV
jgi:hypothetical protein